VDSTDADLLRELERGIPVVEEPFAEIGGRIGISRDEALERTRRLVAEGAIRKIRARINQRLLGISANALVAWQVPAGWEPEAFSRFASFPGVSHCYLRRPVPGKWEYSVYTVHHGRSREEVLFALEEMAREAGVSEYVVLFSTGEFKRVPNVRIDENGGELK